MAIRPTVILTRILYELKCPRRWGILGCTCPTNYAHSSELGVYRRFRYCTAVARSSAICGAGARFGCGVTCANGRLSLLHRVNPRPTATSPAGGRTTAIPSRSFAQIENKQDWTAIACVKIISSANTPTLRLWSIANGYENPGFDAASPGTVRTFVPMHPSWQGPTTRQPVLERILRDLPCGDQDRSCHGHLRVCGLRRSASAGARFGCRCGSFQGPGRLQRDLGFAQHRGQRLDAPGQRRGRLESVGRKRRRSALLRRAHRRMERVQPTAQTGAGPTRAQAESVYGGRTVSSNTQSPQRLRGDYRRFARTPGLRRRPATNRLCDGPQCQAGESESLGRVVAHAAAGSQGRGEEICLQ